MIEERDWEVRGDTALFEALRAEWQRAADQGAKLAGRSTFAEESFYAKASPLSQRAGRRHARRRWLLGIEPPRLAEFANLAWLREHGFGAPEPRLAAVLANGRLRFQGLVTRWIDGARSFDTASPEELARLGVEVARLHGLGFVHRDLFARNLLLDAQGGWIFLDAWRGGARRGLRGPFWDLACLLEDPPKALDRARADAFLEGYASAGGEAPARRLDRERDRVRRRYSKRA